MASNRNSTQISIDIKGLPVTCLFAMESTKVTEGMEGRAVETRTSGTGIQISAASGFSLCILYFNCLILFYWRHACSTMWQVNDHLPPQCIRESADRKERPFRLSNLRSTKRLRTKIWVEIPQRIM